MIFTPKIVITGGTSGEPISVSTAAEMSEIISGATSTDTGKLYIFTGTTDSNYTQGVVYSLSETLTVTLSTSTLSWSAISAEAFYKIWSDGAVVATTAIGATSVDLSIYITASGDHTVWASAHIANHEIVSVSNSVTYTVS